MKITMLRSVVLAAAIGAASLAFAVGLEHMTKKSVMMKSGKEASFMVGEMDGKKMVVMSAEDFADLFKRAEGHDVPGL